MKMKRRAEVQILLSRPVHTDEEEAWPKVEPMLDTIERLTGKKSCDVKRFYRENVVVKKYEKFTPPISDKMAIGIVTSYSMGVAAHILRKIRLSWQADVADNVARAYFLYFPGLLFHGRIVKHRVAEWIGEEPPECTYLIFYEPRIIEGNDGKVTEITFWRLLHSSLTRPFVIYKMRPQRQLCVEDLVLQSRAYPAYYIVLCHDVREIMRKDVASAFPFPLIYHPLPRRNDVYLPAFIFLSTFLFVRHDNPATTWKS